MPNGRAPEDGCSCSEKTSYQHKLNYPALSCAAQWTAESMHGQRLFYSREHYTFRTLKQVVRQAAGLQGTKAHAFALLHSDVTLSGIPTHQ